MGWGEPHGPVAEPTFTEAEVNAEADRLADVERVKAFLLGLAR